jgi:hypothetical protein
MKMLDFNAVQQPTWPIKLKDDEQTVVTLSAPTTELVDRLIAVTPELEAVAKTKDHQTIKAIFSLIADIMNCNEDGLVFTAEDLRDKYRLTLLDLFKFVPGYLEFIKEMQNAKN